MAAKKPNSSKFQSSPQLSSSETPGKSSEKVPVAPAAAVVTPVAAAAVAAPIAAPVAAVVAASAAATVVAVGAAERDRAGVTGLIAKLRHTDADAARDAAVTLGTLPANADSVSALIAVLLNADHYFHPVVRAAAAASLGKLRDPRAVDALLHATRDSMGEASDEAVRALGRLGDRRAILPLKGIVRNADNFYLANVRASAEVSLKQIGE